LALGRLRARVRDLLGDEAAPGLPLFCLERWQSLHETLDGVIVLSESGVDPPPWSFLELQGVRLQPVGLGYGWTRGSPSLRATIVDQVYDSLVDPDNVVVTVGGAEANLLAASVAAAPGDVVVVDRPNYMQVEGLLRSRGARIVLYERRLDAGWGLEPERLASVILETKPRAVFVTNPNNPTGSLERRLVPVVEAAASVGAVLVFDEVYRGLELDGVPTPSVIEVALEAGAEALSTGSVSKAYGLPGLRIGWLASTSPRLAERAWAVKDYTSISPPRPSEALAEAALRASEPLLERARNIVRRNLELLRGSLGGREIVEPVAGAFALVPVEDSITAAEKLLEEYGVLVNPGECFGVPGYIRVGLGSDPRRVYSAYRVLARALDELDL